MVGILRRQVLCIALELTAGSGEPPGPPRYSAIGTIPKGIDYHANICTRTLQFLFTIKVAIETDIAEKLHSKSAARMLEKTTPILCVPTQQ
jgi:hypothetical protein